MTSEHTEFKDWLDEIITESLGPDWTSRDAATMIIDNLAAEQPAYNAAPDLLEALKEARTSLSITRTNIVTEIGRCADPSESRWAGVPELLKKRLDKIDAAISRAEGRS